MNKRKNNNYSDVSGVVILIWILAILLVFSNWIWSIEYLKQRDYLRSYQTRLNGCKSDMYFLENQLKYANYDLIGCDPIIQEHEWNWIKSAYDSPILTWRNPVAINTSRIKNESRIVIKE